MQIRKTNQRTTTHTWRINFSCCEASSIPYHAGTQDEEAHLTRRAPVTITTIPPLFDGCASNVATWWATFWKGKPCSPKQISKCFTIWVSLHANSQSASRWSHWHLGPSCSQRSASTHSAIYMTVIGEHRVHILNIVFDYRFGFLHITYVERSKIASILIEGLVVKFNKLLYPRLGWLGQCLLVCSRSNGICNQGNL